MSEDMLFVTEDQVEDINSAQAEDVSDMKKYLIFVTDDLKLGVDAELVVEINNDQTITYLPMVPEFVRGIINLRGDIIPIIDIRLRLGKMPMEGCLIIVLRVNGIQLGILVDAVDQMVDISEANLLPVPAQSSQFLVSGMCSLPNDGGTMMVLDCDQLLAHE